MPLDLGDDPAGLGPTGGPVAEVRVIPPHLLWGPADRALQKVSDVALQDCVRRQADRIAKALGFEELIVCVVVTFETGGAEIQRRIWPIWLVDTRRRFCGVASAGVRVSVV